MKRRHYLFVAQVIAIAIVLSVAVGHWPPEESPAATYDERPQPEGPAIDVSAQAVNDTWNLTPNQTVEIEYRYRNWGGEAGGIERTVYLSGPYNETTGIVEGDYHDNDTISARIPPDGSVETSATLTAPPEPGVYVLDMGQLSSGCVIDDGWRKIRVVNETA